MEKKVGNIFDMLYEMFIIKFVRIDYKQNIHCMFFLLCLLIFIPTFGQASSIILRIQDMNHQPIDQVVCNMPFILQVELKNIEAYSDRSILQHLVGIEHFKTSRSMTKSHHTVIENGKQITQVFYNFVLRSDQKGTFTLNALNLYGSNNQKVQSNSLKITVVDELSASHEQDAVKYFLKAFFDKKQAYLGERITLHVEFYDRVFVDDLHIKLPEHKECTILKGKNNIKTRNVTIKGQEYVLTEWVFDLYANQAGLLVLQDIIAVFFAQKLEDRFTFKGGLDFFRSWHKTEKFLRADPIKIEILPLPKNEEFENVHAVGQFSDFIVSVVQDSAQVGQGIILTTEFFGDANFEIMDKVPLILPANFNYYDSNSTVIDEHKRYKKSEFIVQANKEGVYHIPPQSLIYFDPVQACYKKLESNSLDITILQSSKKQIVTDAHDKDKDQDQEKHVKEVVDFTIMQKSNIHKKHRLMIPFYLFHQLIYLLCLLLLVVYVYRYYVHEYVINNKYCVKYKIFWQAHNMCKKAQATQNYSMLQIVFLNLFSQLLKKNIGQLHDTDMVAYLTYNNFSIEQIEAWKDFYHAVLQKSFSSDKTCKEESLFHQAFIWIQLLKGRYEAK